MEGSNSDDDDEWLRATSVLAEVAPAKKRQRKVVTLDDILEADYKESVRKAKPRKPRGKSKAKSHLYSSSDDDSEEDLRAPQLLDELEKQVVSGAGVGDEVEPEWGLPVLVSAQREPPPSLNNEEVAPLLLRALQSSKEEGRETSLEEVARSGFLRAWALSAKKCDESTLRWAYHQMSTSSDESLERATCRFLCGLVRRFSADAEAPFEMAWLPTLLDVKQTLTSYGYKEHEQDAEDAEPPTDTIPADHQTPPKNLRSVLGFLTTCFTKRALMQPYYKPADVANLLVTMVHLTLERSLLAILDKIQDCILVLLRYFSPEEWDAYCSHDFNGIAGTISEFTSKPQNAVFVLGMISGLGKRSVDLQRCLALQELTKLGRRRKVITGAREVAALFENVNLRAKFVDFKRIYYQVVIADTFLWGNGGMGVDGAAMAGWLKFLGACSRVIYIGDERPFATRLRNTASFLVQKYEHEGAPAKAGEEY